MNYKLRLVLNVLKSKEEKEFVLYDGQKMLLSPVGDGKTVNISVGDEETYKTIKDTLPKHKSRYVPGKKVECLFFTFYFLGFISVYLLLFFPNISKHYFKHSSNIFIT